MALVESNMMACGTDAPAFSLMGVDERAYSLDDFSDAAVLVLIFTCNHCPYAVAYEDRLISIQNDYRGRGVQLLAICSNDATTHPGDGMEAMRVRAEEKAFPFPYLRDETQSVARAYNAACTPDVFVFGGDRRLIANTRIDDSWKDASAVGRRDLREILDATLSGDSIPFEPWASMGCNIKWKA